MNYILFDNFRRNYLLPLTFTRPVADIRIGILTIREKWEKYLGATTSSLTEAYLSKKFPIIKQEDNILVNGSVVPTRELAELVIKLKPREAIVKENVIIALHIKEEELEKVGEGDTEGINEIQTTLEYLKIDDSWDVFSNNNQAIIDDYQSITQGKKSRPLDATNTAINTKDIFIEQGAKVNYSLLNASNGPIYIGKDAEIMEGSMIRGPVAICDHAVIKMGAKIYGGTTIGPYCKIGGEVNNSVFFGYSNKAHDGFIGNAVIGEWCNLGAGTNNSNLKNTYDEVRLWSYPDQTFVKTGLQFCGLIMGDHSKCGINTMFNTGSVIGVNANIYGAGFQRNFIPSFAWGGTSGFKFYNFDKAVQVAKAVYARRGKTFDQVEQNILQHIFDQSKH